MSLDTIKPGRRLDHVHSEYAALTPDEIRNRSLAKLQEYIDRGKSQAVKVVQSIMEEVPRDRYVRPAAIQFSNQDTQLGVGIGDDAPVQIHQHALNQLAERVGFNTRYLHDLQKKGDVWAAQLAAQNFNALLAHQDLKDRYLLRQVGSTIRGAMSDAYKCIDSRPVTEALITAASSAKAVVVDGIYTPTKVSLKVVRAKPVEVFPNEWMIFGLSFNNSDYGNGRNEMMAFLLRLACLNGAVDVTEFRKVHLGRRYDGEDGWSNRTMELDAKASASATQDQVRLLLSDAATDNLVKQVRDANERVAEPQKIESFLKTRLSKEETKQVVEKFSSPDIVELPAGQTNWRFSNALSWLAKNTEDGERRMKLEYLAGEVMTA